MAVWYVSVLSKECSYIEGGEENLRARDIRVVKICIVRSVVIWTRHLQLFCFTMAQQPQVGQGLHIIESS